MLKAVLNEYGDINYAVEVGYNDTEIQFAESVTHDGKPHNMQTLKVSRSKENVEKARDFQMLTQRRYKGLIFYVPSKLYVGQ